MTHVSAQVDRQDIEIAFGHRDIVSARHMPRGYGRPHSPQESRHVACPRVAATKLRPCLGAAGGGNQRRTISLGSLWRCSAATCGSADLRVYCSAVRE